MSLGERDPHTGINTTGHEWSGIKELDTPIPKAVKFFYGLTFLIALAMWVLLPTWPLITTYSSGLLGFSQRDLIADLELEDHRVGRAVVIAIHGFDEEIVARG
jgi:cytochrome c oxidase cbb3-type subunit 3